MSAAKRLRDLIAGPGLVIAPGVYDCVSAKVVEKAGYKAAFVSGAAVTASVLGYPDVGLQTMPEILGQVRNMARCVEIPMLVDIDTGYGNALNVMRAVREFEAAGAAGIFFEDQTFPKRCGHFEGKKVIAPEEMVIKIKAACEARRGADFVIVARTDARATHGLDHAIERGQLYARAGADVIYVEALLSEDEMRKVARSINAPLQANVSEGSGKTPVLHFARLHEIGFKIISYSGLLQRTAMRGMLNALEVLKNEGSAISLYPDHLCSLLDRSELLGLQRFYQLEERLYGPLMESEKSWRPALEALSGGAPGSDALPI
ncbi:MAG: isocitrate lyase/PEP mutase family protein [Betaproteobacteria bacterium]|nr:isocitrate lyase/PEP mutase family protein [Betaproteobacteria bacterium]